MEKQDWLKLQNGSDIRGIAVEGEENQHVNLTDDAVFGIAAAFAVWLSEKLDKKSVDLKISIGHDSRISAERLKKSAIDAFIKSGCRVYDCGMASTPAMFMTTVTKGYEYDGAVMITASHLPYNRNGLKFFTAEGGLEKEDITRILEIASEQKIPEGLNGSITKVDFISVYSGILVDKMRKEVNSKEDYEKPLKGFKIVVDAGNGAGGFYADKVLVPAGADITGSQFLDPDGMFPNHIPNPENADAMDSVMHAVLKSKADFGIIFDADVDRAGAVGHDGKEINRNRLIALISSIVLEEHPHTAIVTDSITSTGLKKFIENDLGGIHHRFKRGYRNVINEAIMLNKKGQETYLAIETSGHAALKENYFLDDGAYLITKILIKAASLKKESKDIEQLISKLEEPKESAEFRMKINDENFKVYGNKMIDDLVMYSETHSGWHIAPDNHEGIRVSFDKNNGDGWFLFRLSLHEPLIPLNIESDSIGGVKKIACLLVPFVKKYSKLDSSSLVKYAE